MGTQFSAAAIMVFGSVLTFLSTWFFFQRNIAIAKAKELATEQRATLARITELESKLSLVNQAVIPISLAFQAILVKELTHFHTPEMDILLTKIGPPNTMTSEEAAAFPHMLAARMADMGPLISDSERDAAMILPAVIKRAQAEADVLHGAETLKLKLVTVAAVVGVPGVTT